MGVHNNRKQHDQLYKIKDIVNLKVQSYHWSTLHRQARPTKNLLLDSICLIMCLIVLMRWHTTWNFLMGKTTPQFFTYLCIKKKVGMPNLISATVPCFAVSVEWTSFSCLFLIVAGFGRKADLWRSSWSIVRVCCVRILLGGCSRAYSALP